MQYFYIILFFLFAFKTFAADTTKIAFATRTSSAPKIDCIMEEEWNNAKVISDFVQYTPYYNSPPTQNTEVRILYDNHAIYIYAIMHDTHPDSILKQLGNRDSENLNADWFGIEFDTYNNQLDAYLFQITSSGVQMDSREWDDSFNAVWESKTKITNEGWIAEIKIPYSTIRFPKKQVQIWGMEILRYERRNRETSNWALQLKGAENDLVYWGKLKGLENIETPLRLSFNPYVSSGLDIYSQKNFKNAENSWSFAGGLDLKYGLNESFTLDMTLLPDFSQVQSDNKVKNLSAFETVYNEQRPFFNEAVDLFSKGDLFYSRRIGKTPAEFYNVENLLDSGETIKKNPSQAQLLNATKFSGRNKKGLAIGFFNAITNDTWATINKTDGTTRRVLTEPFTNYNILVLDQALKNNSSVFISNSNFYRNKLLYNSNVTAGGFNLVDKTNTWSISANGGYSRFYYRGGTPAGVATPSPGMKYAISTGKVNGKFKFELSHSLMDKNFNANDVGLTLYNNYINNSIWLSYNIYEPFWKLRELSNNIRLSNNYNFSNQHLTGLNLNYNFWGTLNNYLSLWGNFNSMISEVYDYYETRVEERYFIRKRTTGFSIGYSSDYRKPFALDGDIGIWETPGFNDHFKQMEISPLIRLSDHFSFRYNFRIDNQLNEKGFATLTSDSIIFGNRDVNTITNTFSGNYIIKNDLSISLRVRHYWSKGEYDHFYFLEDNGSLSQIAEVFNENFNFNSFNIDLVFNWQFAPGSNLSFVWKKEILSESDVIINSFSKNFSNTFEQPQWNTFSIKAIYYLDYQYLKKNK